MYRHSTRVHWPLELGKLQEGAGADRLVSQTRQALGTSATASGSAMELQPTHGERWGGPNAEFSRDEGDNAELLRRALPLSLGRQSSRICLHIGVIGPGGC